MGISAVRALLFSGGLDSTALAYSLHPDIAVTVDYGQVCAPAEVRASRIICEELGLRHEVIRADLSNLGVGPLAGRQSADESMPPEWWPYRNQMLATLAAMFLASRNVKEILIGTVAGDTEHCDGKPAFIEALNTTFKTQKPYISFSAPVAHLTALELLHWSKVPRSLLGWCFSCHVDSVGCGTCRGCAKYVETLSKFERNLTS